MLKAKHVIICEAILLLLLITCVFYRNYQRDTIETLKQTEGDFIKWVDFDICYAALDKAYDYDVQTYQSDVHVSWIEILAYLGAKYGGDFSKYKEKDMRLFVDKLTKKEDTLENITKSMKYYDYYYEVYSAVIGGMVGEYKIEVINKETGEKEWKDKYGLKAFSPVAKNFPYSDFDDFGVSRTYGYKRKHLGHDMMGQVGTPVIAVESGYVEAMGWNMYGGWRLGIRSFDGTRYYYYAHLRKNWPYTKTLQIGDVVCAGDVIGYLGRTGYSRTENTNNINTSHLHFGIQLIFDESQKEGNGEIWIDCYQIIRFLYQNRSETIKDEETKEYGRVYQMIDPMVENYKLEKKQTEYNDKNIKIIEYE